VDNQGNDGGKSQKSSKPHFCCLYFKQISSWVALFFFKSDGLLDIDPVLLKRIDAIAVRLGIKRAAAMSLAMARFADAEEKGS
jgi:hypothetical protein